MGSFAREKINFAAIIGFDEEVREAVTPYLKDEKVEMEIVGSVIWGKPLLFCASNSTIIHIALPHTDAAVADINGHGGGGLAGDGFGAGLD